jgi:hypothetical protein
LFLQAKEAQPSVLAAFYGRSQYSMKVYAHLCGWTLARAHARSGDRFALGGYLGRSAKFDNAIADFAETYADQNERARSEPP